MQKNSVFFISRMDREKSTIVFIPDHVQNDASEDTSRGDNCCLELELDCDCGTANVRGIRDSIFTSLIKKLVDDGFLNEGDTFSNSITMVWSC